VAFIDEQKLSWYGTLDQMRVAKHDRLEEFIKASEYKI
jgi:phospholipid/cholesterol/gamma-HCH transport system ATP-binding protein